MMLFKDENGAERPDDLDELIMDAFMPAAAMAYTPKQFVDEIRKIINESVVAELESLTGISNEIPEYVIRDRIKQLTAPERQTNE